MAKHDPRALAEQRVGQTLNDKWRLDRLLDVGGMAAVYVATHRNGKRVALKILNPVIAANADLRRRFLREGYAANKVVHRGAVQVLDDDVTADGAAFLVMELLEGQSLERRMKLAPEGRVPMDEVLGIADQVLDTLAAFHASGVIHRDIKPGNLFLSEEGQVKVLDFGLARMRDSSGGGGGAPFTGAGMVLGTASYMPPEQALGKSDEIDARTDLFAVGAVMFHAITGRSFARGATPMDRVMNAMREPAPPIASFLPAVPDFVATVVDTALAFDKKNRWPDANSMRAAIRVASSALSHQAKRRSIPPPVPAARRPDPPPPAPVKVDRPAPTLVSAGVPVSIGLPASSGIPVSSRALDFAVTIEEASIGVPISIDAREVSSLEVIPLVAVRSRTGVPPPLPRAQPELDEAEPLSMSSFEEVVEPSLVVDVSLGGIPTPKVSGGE